MAQLLIQYGTDTPTVHDLNGSSVSIGRSPENTIVLDDPSVSSHHAVIVPAGGGWLLRDLQSSNGVTVNDAAILEHQLRETDLIRFGAVPCQYKVGAKARNLEAPSAASAAGQRVSLRSQLGDYIGNLVGEGSRLGQLAARRGKVEKLRTFDLESAYAELGRTSYKADLPHEDSAMFKEITELEQRIVALAGKKDSSFGDTNTNKLKRFGGNVAGQARGAALKLELRQLYAALGRSLEKTAHSYPAVAVCLAKVEEVKGLIWDLESQCTALAENSGHRQAIKNASRTAIDEVRDNTKVFSQVLRGGESGLLSHCRIRRMAATLRERITFEQICAVAIAVVLIVIGCLSRSDIGSPKPAADVSDSSLKSEAATPPEPSASVPRVTLVRFEPPSFGNILSGKSYPELTKIYRQKMAENGIVITELIAQGHIGKLALTYHTLNGSMGGLPGYTLEHHVHRHLDDIFSPFQRGMHALYAFAREDNTLTEDQRARLLDLMDEYIAHAGTEDDAEREFVGRLAGIARIGPSTVARLRKDPILARRGLQLMQNGE